MTGCRRGFSLTEIAVVLAILVLLMAIVLPAIGPMRRQNRMRAASATVAGALRLARSMAIAGSAVYTVGFETATDPDEVRIWSGSGSKSKPDRRERLPAGVDFVTPVPTGSFQPDGSASSGLSVKIRNERDEQYRIEVSPASGRVKVSRVTK